MSQTFQISLDSCEVLLPNVPTNWYLRLTRLRVDDLPLPLTPVGVMAEAQLQARRRSNGKVLKTWLVSYIGAGGGGSLDIPIGKIFKLLKYGKYADDVDKVKDVADKTKWATDKAKGLEPVQTEWQRIRVHVPLTSNMKWEDRRRNLRVKDAVEDKLSLDLLMGRGGFHTGAVEGIAAKNEGGEATFSSVHRHSKVFGVAKFDLSGWALSSLGFSAKTTMGEWAEGSVESRYEPQTESSTDDKCYVQPETGDVWLMKDGKIYQGKVEPSSTE